jgi:drug/metabolite transporter superfamily protein YnfA
MYSGSGLPGILLRIILRHFSCAATGWWEKKVLGRSLAVFGRFAAHGLFICCSLEWTSPVDKLWKYLNPPSADYIETDVIKG